MKKISLYYISIFLPLIILLVFSKYKLISNVWFCISLFFYAFIYRALTDYWRLRSKNIIEKMSLVKIFLSGFVFKYFKELYLP